MTAEDRDEIRKLIREELNKAAPQRGLVVRRVGVPLEAEELAGVPERLVAAAGDQCCNGCD